MSSLAFLPYFLKIIFTNNVPLSCLASCLIFIRTSVPAMNMTLRIITCALQLHVGKFIPTILPSVTGMKLTCLSDRVSGASTIACI